LKGHINNIGNIGLRQEMVETGNRVVDLPLYIEVAPTYLWVSQKVPCAGNVDRKRNHRSTYFVSPENFGST
jgi:hypothetical protein